VLGLVKSAPAAANSFIASASALIGRMTPQRVSRDRTVMPNPLAGEVGRECDWEGSMVARDRCADGEGTPLSVDQVSPICQAFVRWSRSPPTARRVLQRDSLSSLPKPAPYWRLGWRIAITMCAPVFWACQQDTVGVLRRAYCRGGKRHKDTRLQPRTLLMIGGKEGLVSVPIESVPIPGSSSSDHQHG